MTSQVFTVRVTNEFGQFGEAPVTIQFADAPSISGATVIPANAAPGATRTITVVATDPQGSVLVYTLKKADGTNVPLTPVAGQPGSFTFVP